MTFFEAMAAQPTWVTLWLAWMAVGAFLLPLALFIWRETRLMAVIIILTHTLNGIAVTYLFNTLGYVKLLGFPHLIFWGPLLWYLLRQLNTHDLPSPARTIIWVLVATLAVSLAFDLVDSIRYVLGERAPFAGTEPVNL